VQDAFWSDDVSMRELQFIFNSLAKDESIKAVILDIDSPGGSASGMHDLHESAKALGAAKPLFAHVSDYAASAAYYLATAAQDIYAGHRTAVGSIGTRMLIYDQSKFYENLGVIAIAIDTGEYKSLGAPGTEITENHKTHLQHLVDMYQEDFDKAVNEGRSMSAEEYKSVSDGRLFLAEEAVGLKLIDGVQSLALTIEVAEASVAKSAVTMRKEKMSEETTVIEPQAATLADFKSNLPGADSDFMLEQLEKKVTVQEAMKTFLALQQTKNEQLALDKTEAEAKVVVAEKKSQENIGTQKKRGNSTVAQTGNEEGEMDFRQLAMDFQEKRQCRWSEACMHIKRKYPESQEFFGMPSK